MKLGFTRLILSAFVAFALGSQALMADTLDFAYSFPISGVAASVTGTGVLTTTPLANNQYTIIDITGSRTVNGATDNIASLLPPGGFAGNDNILFASAPYLDGNGFSFLLSTGGGDNGTGAVNVYYDSMMNAYTLGGYTENSPKVGFGTFTISAGAIVVPEPMPPTFAVLALFGAVSWWRRQRACR